MKLYARIPGVIFLLFLFFGCDGWKGNKEGLKPLAGTCGNKTSNFSGVAGGAIKDSLPEYVIARISRPPAIDADWEKEQWRDVRSVEITNYMGAKPEFSPRTEVKMLYDDENIFIIFRVHDKFVQSVVQENNGPVFQDACVEFFFSPDRKHPERYFDLEINCGGTPLICYVPREKEFTTTDIKKIAIAHSMPKVVFPEIKKPVTWIVECRIPLSVLEKFADIDKPEEGTCWRGNFFKTASTGSNPHYFTWAIVESDKPNFHLPQYFGKLKFI